MRDTACRCVRWVSAAHSPEHLESRKVLSYNLWHLTCLCALADVSAAFEDLITRLLNKNPARRMGWKDLPDHPFWAEALPRVPIPEEPLLEAFIRDNCMAPSSQHSAAPQASASSCALTQAGPACRSSSCWQCSACSGLICRGCPDPGI